MTGSTTGRPAPHLRLRWGRVLVAAALLSTVTAVVREATDTDSASANLGDVNYASDATITLGSVDNPADRDAAVANLTDGRTGMRFATVTGGPAAVGANFVDLDFGQLRGEDAAPWTMIRIFGAGTAPATANGGAWVFYDDEPFTSSDPDTLVAAGIPNGRLQNPAPQQSTIVAPGRFRYVRIVGADPATALSLAEIEVLGSLGLYVRAPDGAPDTSVNLAAVARATQWPGVDGERQSERAIDGNLFTDARTARAGSGGAFVQIDLRTTVEVGQIEIDGLWNDSSWFCRPSNRLATIDEAAFVDDTDGSQVRSGTWTSTDVATGNRTITIERPVRYVRLQRRSCGQIGVDEVIVRPSSRAVMIDPIVDQELSVGEQRTIDVRLLSDSEAAILVKGLPRGFSYDDRSIVGTAERTGRWTVEVTALALDGRSSTSRFNMVIIDTAPEGAIQEPPALNIEALPDRPSFSGSGVVGAVPGRSSGGNPDDTSPSLDITVWDMIELDGFMYIGGEFWTIVNVDGSTVDQRFLARFHLDTGTFDDSWRPQLDGNVHALEVSPRGRLLVGGEFTSVDGLAETAGLVAFDPRTGEVDPRFEAWVERPWNPDSPAVVRDLRVAGEWLYVVGKFSHINGTGGTRERAFSATRVTANWGTIDSLWKPVVTGRSIWGVSPNHARNRVYLAGYFGAIEGAAGTNSGGTVDAVTGAFVPNNYFPKNSPASPETYDVESFGDVFLAAGSQHVLSESRVDNSPFGSAPASWTYVSNNATSTWAWSGSQPAPGGGAAGGDMQFVEKIGRFVLTGCHCQVEIDANGRGAVYNSITNRSTVGKVALALYADGPQALTPVASFRPDLEGGIDGAWAATTDSRGCLWIGGDVTTAGLRTGNRVFARGFARFCLAPSEVSTNVRAPAAAADSVSLEFDPIPPDDTTATVGYVVRRDGRYIGFVGPDGPFVFEDTTVAPLSTYRYSIHPQAGDLDEGSGSSVEVTTGVDGEPPTAPTDLTVSAAGDDVLLGWSAAADDVAVDGYLIYRDGAYIGFTRDTAYTDVGGFARRSGYTVRAVDVSGKRSEPTPLTFLPEFDPGLDTTPPSIPSGVTVSGANRVATVEWSAATDNIAVDGYLVYRDGGYLGFTTGLTFTDQDAVDGAEYTIRARDVSGNRSETSAGAIYIDLVNPDVSPPSVPESLAIAVDGNTVTLSWEPSTDDRGVTSYLVYRNGRYIGWSPEATFTHTGNLAETGAYQVRAVDAAENRSDLSDPVEIGGPDEEPPSVPVDLVGESIGNTIVLSWSPSSDNVGVTGYLVYRDGAYLVWSGTTTFTDDAPVGVAADYQVRAQDSARNRSAPSVVLTIGEPDTTPPAAPLNIVAELVDGSVVLTWAEAVDDVAVASYLIYRDDAYLGWSPSATFTDAAPLAAPASYTVRAVDTSENRSEKSAAIVVDGGPAGDPPPDA